VFNIFACASSAAGAFSGYNQTARYTVNDTTALLETVIGDAAGAATVNFSVTQASPSGWGAVGIPLL
jgi:hypothetical protein